MIFEKVTNISSKSNFLEKINVYNNIVRAIALKNKLLISSVEINNEIINELMDMGILEDQSSLKLLKDLIRENYDCFISSIYFYLKNKDLFGSVLYKLSNKERLRLQHLEISSSKPNFVDLFAGAGGLSCGFTQAGFKVLFANDIDDTCINTYQFNHPEVPSKNIVQGDLRAIVDNIDSYINSSVDVLVGGPPCQGFSSANQQRIIDDPRNELYKYFIKAIKKVLPKIVIMENVRGMLSVADQVVADYENINEFRDGIHYTYSVSYKLLNSYDFSVAQSRERLIYIAIRNDVSKNQYITPQGIFDEIEQSNINSPKFILSDALDYLKPLEALSIKNKNEIDFEKSGRKIDVNLYEGNDSLYLKLINSNRKIPFVFNHKARYLNELNYEIYKLMDQGDDASNPKIYDIMPYKNRLHCFKDKYYKLIASKPSRTITAHLKMDGHSHIHPYQVRSLTPREAARCQSFPDDYLFLGPYLKTFMQIGNAVPCLMAKRIAEIIKRYL